MNIQAPKKIHPTIQRFIDTYRHELAGTEGQHEFRIQVETMVAKIAIVYERVRNAVEYREEHLYRRNAIERILRRRLILALPAGDELVARKLIEELIRADYLQNHSVPERKVAEVAGVIDKYIRLYRSIPTETREDKRSVRKWINGVASAEIESVLVSQKKDDVLAEAVHRTIAPEVAFVDAEMSEEERRIVLFIAVQRAVLRVDNPTLYFRILTLYYPEWRTADEALVREVGYYFHQLRSAMQAYTRHSLTEYLLVFLKPYGTVFLILRDIIHRYPTNTEAILSDDTQLFGVVNEACEHRYEKTRKVLRRSTVRSVFSILAGKIMLGGMLEIPYDLYFYQSISWLPLLVNTLFHPIVLVLVAISTRVPSGANTRKIYESIRIICFGELSKNDLLFVPPRRQGIFRTKNLAVTYIYSVTYLISFGVIGMVLEYAGFTLMSGIIFIFFLAFVSFFGIRLRKNARELVVIDRKENFLTFTFDFLTVPIVNTGRWLAKYSSQLNVFVLLMDYIIEAPFKSFIEFIERAIVLIKQKKEELY